MKNKALQKERERLQQTSDKDFVSRNYWVKWAALYLLYPIVALWSAFTAGGHLFAHFSNTFNDVTTALIFTFIIAVMIEAGKYVFGSSAMDDLYDGVFSEGIAPIIAFILKLVAAIIIFYFSVSLSIQGGPVVADYWKSETAPPELIDSAPIEEKYNDLVAQQEAIINDARNMTWKGVIVREGQRIIRAANAEITRLNKERTEALEIARNDNAETVAAWESETATTGVWFLGFAGLGELLAVIILIFCVNYEAGGKPGETAATKLQTERNGETQPQAQPFDIDGFTQDILSRLHASQQPRQVVNPNVDKTNSGVLQTAFGGKLNRNAPQQGETQETKPILEAKLSESKPPATKFATERNRETQPQPKPLRQGKTGLVIKNKKVLHDDKWYDLSQVKSNYRANKSKANKYASQGNKEKENKYRKQAAMWSAYAQEIEEATHIK
jgi:hypothetical protein